LDEEDEDDDAFAFFLGGILSLSLSLSLFLCGGWQSDSVTGEEKREVEGTTCEL